MVESLLYWLKSCCFFSHSETIRSINKFTILLLYNIRELSCINPNAETLYPLQLQAFSVLSCTIPKMVILGIVVLVLSVIYHAVYIALYAVYFGFKAVFVALWIIHHSSDKSCYSLIFDRTRGSAYNRKEFLTDPTPRFLFCEKTKIWFRPL